MKINSNRLYGLGLSVLLAGMTVEALAGSTFTVTEFPAEGNVRCNDYALNSLVESLDTSNPRLSGTLSNGDQSADYEFDDSSMTSLNFTVASGGAPVDYAVMKADSGRDVIVLIYASGGISNDTLMEFPGGTTAIGAFSLCYGLGNAELPPPPEEPFDPPRCEELPDFELQGTGISCDPLSGPRVITSWDVGSDRGDDVFCTCNADATECDPTLVEGDLDFATDGCPSGEPLKATPHGAFFIPDGTTYCWDAANGKRKCVTF
jgi:hypothetical protein